MPRLLPVPDKPQPSILPVPFECIAPVAQYHIPDVLEMPYRPPLLGASDETTDSGITVRLGGPTCLSGDVIGDYKFSKLPEYGDLLLFGDMAIYTTCKNNTFNGMPLPDIWIRHADRTMQQLTLFNYTDFKERLGSRENGFLAHLSNTFLVSHQCPYPIYNSKRPARHNVFIISVN